MPAHPSAEGLCPLHADRRICHRGFRRIQGCRLFGYSPTASWSDEVLEKLDIDKSMLAKVYESPEITGYITEEAAKLTGLGGGHAGGWRRR